MSGQNDGRTTGLWHLVLHGRMHQSMKQTIVQWGFFTSFIFTGLIFVNIFVPNLFVPIRYWIALLYMAFQLAETAARDPLNAAEVMEDHIFSLIPAVLALFLIGFHLFSQSGLLTSEGLKTLNFWNAAAWIDFLFGLWMSGRILSTPYERDETNDRH